jgi:hypothetical protein
VQGNVINQPGMDYIKQINAFWAKCEMDMDLKPSSSIVYLALLQINNRCGWKDRFRVSFGQVLSMTGITKNTYYSALKELVDGGYLLYEKGPNQYQSAFFQINMLYQNLVLHEESTGNALGTAKGMHRESTGNIPKPLKTTKPETDKTVGGNKRFIPPSHTEVQEFFESKINETFWTADQCQFQAQRFVNFYESKNWMVGKTKMAKWKSAASGWVNRSMEDQKQKTTTQPQKGFQAAMDMYNKLKL